MVSASGASVWGRRLTTSASRSVADNVARDSFAPRLVTTPLVRTLEQGSVRRIAPVFTVSAASGERIADSASANDDREVGMTFLHEQLVIDAQNVLIGQVVALATGQRIQDRERDPAPGSGVLDQAAAIMRARESPEIWRITPIYLTASAPISAQHRHWSLDEALAW